VTLNQANAPTLTPFSKENEIWCLQRLQRSAAYNRVSERRTASTGYWWSSEQSTGVWAAADAERIPMKTSTQLSRCCWVRKTNIRATEQTHEAGGSINHQCRRLFTKICVSPAALRKGALNSW